MLKCSLTKAILGTVFLLACTEARAGVVSFDGSMTAFGAAGPQPSCAPLPVGGSVDASTSIGTSSLGDFTYTHNICFNPFGGPFQGTFLMSFGGADAFSGTLNGTDSPDSTPGVFDVQWTYDILAGSGRFAGASGTFTGIGTVDPRVFPAPEAITFAGEINVASVPEPGSWALMLLGFTGLGLALRHSRAGFRTIPQIA